MPASGPIFTDWEQIEADSQRPLLEEDFSWSDAPARRRRSRGASITARERRGRRDAREYDDWLEPLDVESELDNAWGGRLSAQSKGQQPYAEPPHAEEQHDAEPEYYEADVEHYDARQAADGYAQAPFDLGEAPVYDEVTGRRTVVIRGRGAERLPAPRRRRAELAFHERAGLNPDRTAKWAVLLGVVLLLACVIH